MNSMNEVLHANIFFFITGVAVIIFTFVLCIFLYHLIRILKSIRRVMDRIEAGSEVIAKDMQDIRTYVTEDNFIIRMVGHLFKERDSEVMNDEPAKRGAPTSKDIRRQPRKTELKIREES